MAALDDSIVLLSSMSPKIDTGEKTPARKKASKLSLKKYFRQSLEFEKPRGIRQPKMLELEKNSIEHASFEFDVRSKVKAEGVVVVPNSDDEEEEIKNNFACPILSESRHRIISNWLEKVNSENFENVTDETIYSNLSVISGERRQSYQNGTANSTFITGDKGRRFHQLFDEANNEGKEKKDVVTNVGNIHVLGNGNDIGDNVNVKNTVKSNGILQAQKNIDEPCAAEHVHTSKSKQEEQEKLLDELYGNSWRLNKDKVFPKTEPKKRQNIPTSKYYELQTEKPRKITYKNPYLDSEMAKSNNLLRNLHTARVRVMLESSFTARLQELCDSDTCSEEAVNTGGELPRRRLDFCESDSEKENGDLADKLRKILSENDGSNNVLLDKNRENEVKCDGRELTPTTKKGVVEGLKKLNIENRTRKKNVASTKFVLRDKAVISDSETSSEVEWPPQVVRKAKTDVAKRKLAPKEGVTLSFLASLSLNAPASHCDVSAKLFRDCYKAYKSQLSRKLFKIYNEKVFDNVIPADTPLEWNDKLRGTAGSCHCRKTLRESGKVEYSVRIVLSTKVLDSAERLRDTLIHEMCHAATYLVNKVSEGHGPYWKAWVSKAMRVFPELPPVKVCHNYQINTKYTYKCVNCAYCIGRHSKSLNMERMRCGHCTGKFELLVNKTTKDGGVQSVPVTPRKEVTGFALFVKQNYAHLRTPERKHKDVMQLLSKKFNDMKTQ